MAFRRDNLHGCVASFEEDHELFWLFLFNRVGKRFDIVNFPIKSSDYYNPLIERLTDNKYLIITYIAPNPLNDHRLFKFHPFVADLDSGKIANHFLGDMIDSGNSIYGDFNSNLIINGLHSIWLGDTLFCYMRIPPTSYFHHRIVKDSLVVMAFDRSGNKINLKRVINQKILYINIEQLDGTVQLVNCRSGTRKGYKINWKYKFGLISFKDFPRIYIDLGEE